jgi:hypothetical protein
MQLIDKNKHALVADDDDELLTIISICLNDLVGLVYKGPEVSSSVNILNFMLRIKRYSKCSDACFLVAMVYLDRIVNNGGFVLSTHNVHRVLLTAIMVAAKFHEDHFYNNALFAKLGDLTLSEMNCLEIELLQQLRFSLVVTSELYNKYYYQLCCYRERARSLSHALEHSPVIQTTPGIPLAQPVLLALPLSPGGSVLSGYPPSPPGLTAPPAQLVQPLHMPPPPGLVARAMPMHYTQQQPPMVYHTQVLPMPMPVALPVTPVLSYNTPPFLAKLPVYHHNQQLQQQHQEQ